jgi:hypothetical protein
MKRIYISIVLLFFAMVTMAYLYFSKLNKDNLQNNISLYAATYKSAVVFSIQNEKSVYEILKGQDLLQQFVSNETRKEMAALKDNILSGPELAQLFNHQSLYLSFTPGVNHKTDYLVSIQLTESMAYEQFYNILKKSHTAIEDLPGMKKLTLKDSSIYYIGLENSLMLISNSAQKISSTLAYVKNNESNNSVSDVKPDPVLKKNSLANLYINFNYFPELLENVSNIKKDKSNIFYGKNIFANLSYNFSKENLLFNGNTKLKDTTDYLQLFLGLKPQKITIDKILPLNTANYTVFAIEQYLPWRQKFTKWLLRQENQDFKKTLNLLNTKYHINLEEVMQKFVTNEFMSFQLGTSERLGAISLNNGDKFEQQLIDISESYTDEVKRLKEPNLLYYFFGNPFKDFKQPYYAVIDNYMIFANNASTVEDVLNSYKRNILLSNSSPYNEISTEISITSNITYYLNRRQSLPLLKNTLLPEYYKIVSNKKDVSSFETLTYQLSSDKETFQTIMLLNTSRSYLQTDTH